jgi:hypothetical protein
VAVRCQTGNPNLLIAPSSFVLSYRSWSTPSAFGLVLASPSLVVRGHGSPSVHGLNV